jgi:hypothetical protein
MAASPPACGKTQADHSQRRTTVNASENVTVVLPGQDTDPNRCSAGRAANHNATTVYRPNRHGAARNTVDRRQPLVVSKPRWARASWKVVSICQP